MSAVALTNKQIQDFDALFKKLLIDQGFREDTINYSVGSQVTAGSQFPDQTGNSGKVLGTDGLVTSWVAGGGGGGARDVLVVSIVNEPILSGSIGIDGVSLNPGDEVLLTAQTTNSQRGVWVVQSGAWTRATGFMLGDQVAGITLRVTQGGTLANTFWLCANGDNAFFDPPNSVILGTDILIIPQYSFNYAKNLLFNRVATIGGDTALISTNNVNSGIGLGITVRGAAGGSGSIGGPVNITGGTGGTYNGVLTGAGGNITIIPGQGGANTIPPGVGSVGGTGLLTLAGAVGSSSLNSLSSAASAGIAETGGQGGAGTAIASGGSGGSVTVTGGLGGSNLGAGGGVGGNVAHTGGTGASGSGASIARLGGLATLVGGSGGNGTSLTTGATGGGSTIAGGQGGANLGAGGGLGGAVNCTGGAGRQGSGVSPGSIGGSVSATGGAGGSASSTGAGGVGGALTLAAGTGGGTVGAGSTSGAGGTTIIRGGNAGSAGAGGAGAAGGNITVDGGSNSGLATSAGVVNIGTSVAESVNLGRTGKVVNMLGQVSFPTGVFSALPPSTDDGLAWLLGTTSLRWHKAHIGTGGIQSDGIFSTIFGPFAIASAGTIVVTHNFHHVSGVALISTITPPDTEGGANPPFKGKITIIPDGLFTWDTAGNIALAGAAVVNRALDFVYDGTLWYPSYF